MSDSEDYDESSPIVATAPATVASSSSAAAPAPKQDETALEIAGSTASGSSTPDPVAATLPPMPGSSGRVAHLARQPQWGPATAPGMDDAQAVFIDFGRRHLLRFLYFALPFVLADFAFTPIVALLVAPAAVMTIYWLRDEARFQYGGDMRRCSNRDCSLTYLMVTGAAALAIAAFCVVELALMLSKPKTGDDAADAELHKAGSPKQHSTFHKLALVNNAVLTPLLAITLHANIRLRRLLGTAPRTFRGDALGSDDEEV